MASSHGVPPGGVALRLGAFYGAIFAFAGVHLPFWPVWLKGQGLDAASLSLVLAVPVWLRLAMPVVAPWVDRTGLRRQAIALGMWLTVAALLAFDSVSGFWPILLVAVWMGLAYGPLVPLADNLTMLHVYAANLDYGRIRLWGSVTFILANLAAGALLGDFDSGVILWLLLGMAVAGGLIAFALPAAPAPAPAPAPARADRPAQAVRPAHPLRALLAQPLFLLFLAAGALSSASHAVLYAFGSLHWQSAGIPDALIGLLWAVGVVAEIALFAVSNRAVRLCGPVGLLLLGAGAGALRWTATAFTADPALLLPLQLLHGLTFGATHLGAMHFIARGVARPYSATAQMLYAAASGGIGMGLGLLLAGQLYAAIGIQAMLAMALCAGLALAGFAWLGLRWGGRVLGAED